VQNSARKEGYFSEHSVVKSSRSDTLVKEALIEIGCVVTSLVGWLPRACTVSKRCILGL